MEVYAGYRFEVAGLGKLPSVSEEAKAECSLVRQVPYHVGNAGAAAEYLQILDFEPERDAVDGIERLEAVADINGEDKIFDGVGIVKLLVALHIHQALQNLLEHVFELVVLEGLSVVFAVVDGEVARQLELSEQHVGFAAAVELACHFVLLVAEHVRTLAHHLDALDAFEELLVHSVEFLFGAFDEIHEFADICNAKTDAKTFDGVTIFGSLPASCEAVLDFLANAIDAVLVNVDNLMDVVGNADLQVSNNEMELLDEALVDVLAVVPHDLLYH